MCLIETKFSIFIVEDKDICWLPIKRQKGVVKCVLDEEIEIFLYQSLDVCWRKQRLAILMSGCSRLG